MGRKTVTISMPEWMHRYIENRVKEEYGAVSEYFRDLVRGDRQRQINLTNSANRFAAPTVPVPNREYRPPLASAARRK